MNKEILVPGLVGILIGVVLTLGFSSMGSGMMGRGSSMMDSGNSATNGNQMMASIDAHFIEQMIPHHEDAITMAGIALEKSERSEIKRLAEDINRTQSAEIQQMQNWYRDWFGKDVPDAFANTDHGMGSGSIHMGMMGDATDMESLESSTDFDKAFIEEMIPHHQMAVMMAQMLEQSTDRPEMKQLAKEIIAAQTKEIESMREWYREWYGE